MPLARQVENRRVRYAIVGAGWISQAALMPGAAHTGNSELAALVTGDPKKAESLGRHYGITKAFHYDAYHALLADPDIDAIYLALPNEQHRQFAVPALEAGLHVLLEKPMATSEADCRAIEQAAATTGAKLMLAYRLHFEPATLDAIREVRAGSIGTARLFTATFSQHVAATNHRAHQGFWAGPVPDMGPYPINAVRNLFAAEPIEVIALGTHGPGLPFDFHDTVAVTLRFPGERLAQFSVSYGLNSIGSYSIVGDKGAITVDPGFTFPGPLALTLTQGSTHTPRHYPATDQFGGELQYFSECILRNEHPEPDGEEGRLDVRILAAIEQSLTSGRPVSLDPVERHRRANPSQVRTLPPVHHPALVNAHEPAQG